MHIYKHFTHAYMALTLTPKTQRQFEHFEGFVLFSNNAKGVRVKPRGF